MRDFIKGILISLGLAILCIGVVSIGQQLRYTATVAPGVFVLGDDIMGNTSSYRELVDALQTADAKSHIVIILRQNNGGYVSLEHWLREEMRRSKATITTVVDGWASSAAMTVLFSGDFVKIQKNTHTGIAHLKFNTSTGTRTPAMMEEDLAYSYFYRPFMTDKEWERMAVGEDVLLQGSRICNTARQYVVQSTKDFCLIKNPDSR